MIGLGWLQCFIAGEHLWRRPRKDEVQSMRVCRRCGKVAVIQKRKPKEDAHHAVR